MIKKLLLIPLLLVVLCGCGETTEIAISDCVERDTFQTPSPAVEEAEEAEEEPEVEYFDGEISKFTTTPKNVFRYPSGHCPVCQTLGEESGFGNYKYIFLRCLNCGNLFSKSKEGEER